MINHKFSYSATSYKLNGKNTDIMLELYLNAALGIPCFNPIALRTAKTPWSFGCSECNMVKHYMLKQVSKFYRSKMKCNCLINSTSSCAVKIIAESGQWNVILAGHLGPVVQSIVSLMSSHCKSFSHFFNKKYWIISDIKV